MSLLSPLPLSQSHDFTFSTTYSRPVYAEDLILLANTYGLQHTVRPGQEPQQARLHIKPKSLELQNSILEGLKSKKMADLVYKAQVDETKFDSSHLHNLQGLSPAELYSLFLTLLFEHKLASGPQALWQLLDYTSLLRQANYTNIVPILFLQSGPLPSSLLPDRGRELVGLGLIEFPCFILYLPNIPDEALLDPNLTSGGILFIMKKYEDIKKFNTAGQEALRQVVRYFRALPDERQQFLLGVGWQYMYSLNNSIDEVTMGRIEREVIRPGEKEVLTPKLQTWEEMWKEEALKRGVQQGMQQGMEQGMQQGMQQGAMENQRQMVANLLAIMAPEKISKHCKVPLDVVLDIQRRKGNK